MDSNGTNQKIQILLIYIVELEICFSWTLYYLFI